MSLFDEYANKYKTARMDRRNGVLQVTLHTDGQSLRWGFLPHGELPEAFLRHDDVVRKRKQGGGNRALAQGLDAVGNGARLDESHPVRVDSFSLY